MRGLPDPLLILLPHRIHLDNGKSRAKWVPGIDSISGIFFSTLNCYSLDFPGSFYAILAHAIVCNPFRESSQTV